jgi:hypothetical protein
MVKSAEEDPREFLVSMTIDQDEIFDKKLVVGRIIDMIASRYPGDVKSTVLADMKSAVAKGDGSLIDEIEVVSISMKDAKDYVLRVLFHSALIPQKTR